MPHDYAMESSDWTERSDSLWQKIEDEMVTARYLRWRAYVLREQSQAMRRERQGLAGGAGQENKVLTAWDDPQPLKPVNLLKSITTIDVGEVWDR